MFIHVPKTGGTSINKMLSNQYKWNIPQSRLSNHQPIFILEKYNNLSDYYIFTVVRNPFKRAYSYYQHYQKVSGTRTTFREFLDTVKSNNKTIDELKHLEIIPTESRTPFIPFTQSFYLFDSAGDMRIDRIYKHENLDQLENDFNIQLPKLNSGSYDKTDYIKAYTSEIIDLVRDIYSEDFENLGYSKDFS